MPEEAKLYGVAAEFESPEALLAAVAVMRERGFGRLDAFSPLPIAGLDAALGLRGPILGWVTTAGVVLSGLLCFGIMSWETVFDYPLNIGGRPLWSWPYFVIPSFAFAMACGGGIPFVAMLFLDRLPRINHPIFNIDGIHRVTHDRLFLAVEARSEDFDPAAVEFALANLAQRPNRIQRVPR
jgi:hypothetical protein